MAYLHNQLSKIYHAQGDDELDLIVKAVFSPKSCKINGHAKKPEWWHRKGLGDLQKYLWHQTSFLSENAPLSSRLYSVLHGLSGVPVCETCSQPVHFSGLEHPPTQCSVHVQSSDEIKKKRTRTMLQRYGVENYSSHPECRQKVKSTNLKNWGVENVSQHREVKSKVRDTVLRRYGVENYAKTSEFAIKFRHRIQERYGVDHPMHLDSVKQKVQQTSMERYGVPNPSQCEQIARNINTASFSQELKHVINSDESDQILLKKWHEHGWHWFKVNGASDTWVYHRLGRLGVKFQGNTNKCEQVMGGLLDQMGINYVEKCRSVIKNTQGNACELDFYLPEHDLAIEINGLYWHSELQGKTRLYHLNKTLSCEQLGIQLIHVTDCDLNNKYHIVKSRIQNLLRASRRIHARKTQLVQLTHQQKTLFFQNNHLQGDCASSWAMGLIHDHQLVAAMSLGKPRFNSHHEWELLRFCNLAGHCVLGGASKLFQNFLKTHQPSSVISYSDRCWSTVITPGLYSNLGFKLIGTSKPNYWYTRDYRNLISRVKFQKHKQQYLLEHFSSELSEWQNMKNNGWDRYWDAGNHVWSWGLSD